MCAFHVVLANLLIGNVDDAILLYSVRGTEGQRVQVGCFNEFKVFQSAAININAQI